MSSWGSMVHQRGLRYVAILAVLLTPTISAGQFVTVNGTVQHKSGAVVAGAQVSLIRNGQTIATTTTNSEGRFSFHSLAAALYDVEARVLGFSVERVKGILASASESANITIVIGAGTHLTKAISLPPLDMPAPPTLEMPAPPTRPPDHRTFTDPMWNVWSETVSAIPNFVPVKMQPNHDYSLVVDLSAVRYSDYSRSAVYSQQGSSALSSWLKENAQLREADVDVLVLPDLRHYAPQLQGEKIKSLTINLQKVRDAQQHGFPLMDSPFDILSLPNANAPFDFGSRTFRIRTGLLTGRAPIALSVWANGKPIDEASFSLCIVANDNDPCVPASTTNDTLNGVDLSGRGQLPTAALHLIDRGTDIVGVYRCNQCNWAKDDYRTWQIQESGESFSDRVKEIVGTVAAGNEPQPGSSVTLAQTFEEAGDDLSNLVFESLERDVGIVKDSLGGILAKGRLVALAGHPPPTLFVRLIPSRPELVLIPAGLMRLKMEDATFEFLGAYVDIQSPLEFQDYSKPSTCISQWVLFVPPRPAEVPPWLKDVEDARSQVNDQIEEFHDACGDCVMNDEKKFDSWLKKTDAPALSEGVVVLSNQSGNTLYFNDNGSPAVHSSSVVRPFATPSFVLLDACGTGEPGTSEFVRRFNSVGVNSVIATSTKINPFLAGKFLNAFFAYLHKHSNDETYTLSMARFDAVKDLMQQRDENKDENGYFFGPRALMFVFAGNGAIRACVPATELPKATTN